MQIEVISVHNKLPNWVEMATSHYAKALNSFCKLTLTRINAKVPQNYTADQIKSSQSTQIFNYLKPTDYVIALDVLGTQISSEKLASKFEQITLQYSKAVFIIGGAEGLDPSILKRANFTLSLSKFTLPHNLAKVTILEQIYRAFSINNNHPYHRS